MAWPDDARHMTHSPGGPVSSQTINEVQDRLVETNQSLDVEHDRTDGSHKAIHADSLEALGAIVGGDFDHGSIVESTYWLRPTDVHADTGWTLNHDDGEHSYHSTSATGTEGLWLYFDNFPAGQLYQVLFDVEMAALGHSSVGIHKITPGTGRSVLVSAIAISPGTPETRAARVFAVAGTPSLTNDEQLVFCFSPDAAEAVEGNYRRIYRAVGLTIKHTKISRYR